MTKFKKVLQVFAMTVLIVVGASMMPGCSAGGSALGGKEEYKVLMPDGQHCTEAGLTKMLNDYAKEGWKVRTGGWGNGFAFIVLAR